MQAVVYKRYGPPDVLELREVERPRPKDGEVLVRVHAAGVGAGDWHLLTASMFAVRLYQGLFRPKRRILGHDLSGTVEAVGPGVTAFRPGDEVFGSSFHAGAFAEFACVPEGGLAPKPAGLSHTGAAAVPSSGITALQGLRDKGRVRAGQAVLIHGASGGVGSFAVQIAKAHGATVTGVCSTAKLDFVRSLGADRVLDYTREDFAELGDRYDLILDMVGKHSLAACRRALAPDGVYVAVSGAPTRSLRIALIGGKRMRAFIAKPNRADLLVLSELLESGRLRPRVDRCYALPEVPEALRELGAGRVRGKLVVAVARQSRRPASRIR